MSVSLQEKNPSGRQRSPDFCCMTPLIQLSEASTVKESSAFGAGCWRGTATARRRLAVLNAFLAETVHFNILAPPSGDRLKVSKLVYSCAKNGGKSLPCQENVAVV